MNGIFFSNPSLASDQVMDFLLLIGFSSFSCLFLPVLLWSLYPLPPNSFHFMTGCCFCSPLGPSLKVIPSWNKWQIHQWEIFSTTMLKILSPERPSHVLSALLWSQATPRLNLIAVPNTLGKFTLLFLYHFLFILLLIWFTNVTLHLVWPALCYS